MSKLTNPPVTDIELAARRWLSEAPEREERELARQASAEQRAKENAAERVRYGPKICRTAYHTIREEALPADEETAYWRRWDEWCQEHIAAALEAERAELLETFGKALSKERAKFRKELDALEQRLLTRAVEVH